MPQYKVTDPKTGRTVTLTGDSPPTEQELEQVFASLPQPQAPVESKPRTWGQTANDALPMAGGLVGGLAGAAGGPLAAATTSGIGGAAGKGYQQLFRHATELPGAVADIARNIWEGHGAATAQGFRQGATSGIAQAGVAGAKEGVTDLAGGAVAKHVIAPVARGAINVAYRPTLEALQINPNITQDILDKGIGLSKKGLQKARGFTDEAKAYAESLVDNLTNAPRRFLGTPQGLANSHVVSREELLGPVFNSTQSIKNPAQPNALGKILQGADNAPGLSAADNVRQSVEQSLPKDFTPQRALAIKRAEGRKAASVFTDTPDVIARKSFNADLHDAADAALGLRIGPSWKAANKETERALSLQKILEDALNKSATDSHLPLPYDQWLLMRGVTQGNPADVAMALAREAGRIRPLVAGAGHALYKGRNVPTHIVRGGRTLVNEEQQANEQRKKSEGPNLKASRINALYEKYQNGGK